jgi:hypothetical protein
MEETTEKRKRGRPTGTANTTMIEDPLIEPFRIYYDETQFNLVKIKPDGTEEPGWGYHSKLSGVLNKIAKFKLVNNKTYTLRSFIDEYEKLLKEFQDNIKFEL